MGHGFGIEKPAAHANVTHRAPARYMVLIDSAGSTVARLFLESREEVAAFDAGAEEVALMTRGLRPVLGATGPEWDRALAGHNASERANAEIFTLDV